MKKKGNKKSRKRMQFGGEATAPPGSRARRTRAPAAGAGLSNVQKNMLKGAQQHARSTRQNPAKLQELTAQYGQLLKPREGRPAMLPGVPAPGGMRGGGKTKTKAGGALSRDVHSTKYQMGGMVGMSGPPPEIPRFPAAGPAPAPAPSSLSRSQQNLLRQAQEYAQETGQNPQAVQDLTAQHGDLRRPPPAPTSARGRGGPRGGGGRRGGGG